MKRIFFLCGPAALIFLCGTAEAAGTIPPRPLFHYLEPADTELSQTLGGPPGMSRSEQAIELDAVLARQARATEADISRAKADAIPRPLVYAQVLGPHFSSYNLPLTQQILSYAQSDIEALAAPVRKRWSRPAPAVQDPRVRRVFKVQPFGSYPSEPAAVGRLWSGILELLFPTCAAQLARRGAEAGDSQIWAGTAYPSDVEAGRDLADRVLKRLQQIAAFQQDMAGAKSEISRSGAQGRAVGTRCET
jgi:acid phosphatase (class A)